MGLGGKVYALLIETGKEAQEVIQTELGTPQQGKFVPLQYALYQLLELLRVLSLFPSLLWNKLTSAVS